MNQLDQQPINESSFPFMWDGHTHTHLCPHGDGKHLEFYIQRALSLGFKRYSVTEHPPLPDNWLANTALQSALSIDETQFDEYFHTVSVLQDQYADQITIVRGLELDYLYDREVFTNDLVRYCGNRLEEAIISVHFLPGQGGNRCIDYSPIDVTEGLISHHGSIEAVVDLYYDHVELAIRYAATLPIPVRIGHINLIEKFRYALPPIDPELLLHRQGRLLPLLADAGVGVDVNTAGLRLATCQKPYVETWFLQACLNLGIPCVFGSDAHSPSHVGAGMERVREWFET